MPQLFRPYADSVARIVLIAIVVVPFLAIGVAYLIMRSEYITDQTITLNQPVPFSHVHHVGDLGLDCRYCHTGVETSPVASVPPTHVCMTCHSQLYTQTAMLAPVRESIAEDQADSLEQSQQSCRITFISTIPFTSQRASAARPATAQSIRCRFMRQAAPLTMGWCLNCHRDPTPYLRPQSAVFDPDWKPPADQAAQGRKLLVKYLIDNHHLTDCSVCHR